MALMVALKHSDVFAAVSAWAPITDLATWHAETTERGRSVEQHAQYAKDMEAAFGGPPTNPAAALLYRERSPLFRPTAPLRAVKLDLNAGITDGHHGIVPIQHSLRMFDAIVSAPEDRLSSEITEALMENRKDALPRAEPDPTYGEKRVLFRRTVGNTRLTIFDGDHELLPNAALSWLEKQSRP